jgi:hypothetical protein
MKPVHHGEPVEHGEPMRAEEPAEAGAPPRPDLPGRAAPVPQRAPGWYRRSVVLAIVAALGVPAANGALWLQERPPAQGGTRDAPVSVSAPTHVQSGTNTVPPTTAVVDLLERRSRAVLAGDRAAWLATVDPRDAGLVQRQGDLFGRLAALRPTSWSYSLQDGDSGLAAARRSALGGGAFLAHVRLAYRLAPGVGEVERDQHLTLVQRDGRWLVGGDQDGLQQRDLWDLGPVTVARGSRSVVVAARGAPVPAARTAAEADAAARRVDGVSSCPAPLRTWALCSTAPTPPGSPSSRR